MNSPTPPSATIPTITATPSSPAAATDGKRRVRRHWTSEEKTEHLALFADSGLSQVEYCEQMGLSPATFSLWCRQSRVAGEAADEATSEQTFVEVLVTEPTASASTPLAAPAVVIHLSGGTKIEAAVGTDPVWLASLLKALGSA